MIAKYFSVNAGLAPGLFPFGLQKMTETLRSFRHKYYSAISASCFFLNASKKNRLCKKSQFSYIH